MRRSGVIRDYSGLIVSQGIALGCPSMFQSVAANRLKSTDRGTVFEGVHKWFNGGWAEAVPICLPFISSEMVFPAR